MKKLNIVGRQVGRLRYQHGWTQEMLAARLQLEGWMISRSGISKIENGSMYVPDFRLFYFARVFRVEISKLFPTAGLQSAIQDMATQFGCDARRPVDSSDYMSGNQRQRQYGRHHKTRNTDNDRAVGLLDPRVG